MEAVKLVNVRLADQRRALAIINNPNNTQKIHGVRNGVGLWNAKEPTVTWWIWKTKGGCKCIQADYNQWREGDGSV